MTPNQDRTIQAVFDGYVKAPIGEPAYQSAPAPHDYQDARQAEQISMDGAVIGDLVEFHSPHGHQHRVILTAASQPYGNASFATREAALRYMLLIGRRLA